MSEPKPLTREMFIEAANGRLLVTNYSDVRAAVEYMERVLEKHINCDDILKDVIKNVVIRGAFPVFSEDKK